MMWIAAAFSTLSGPHCYREEAGADSRFHRAERIWKISRTLSTVIPYLAGMYLNRPARQCTATQPCMFKPSKENPNRPRLSLFLFSLKESSAMTLSIFPLAYGMRWESRARSSSGGSCHLTMMDFELTLFLQEELSTRSSQNCRWSA